jgi:hypothetical protein
MKAQDPQKTIELNVRAILAVMRGRGLEVENFQPMAQLASKSKSKSKCKQPAPEPEKDILDSILTKEGVEDRFVRLPLN